MGRIIQETPLEKGQELDESENSSQYHRESCVQGLPWDLWGHWLAKWLLLSESGDTPRRMRPELWTRKRTGIIQKNTTEAKHKHTEDGSWGAGPRPEPRLTRLHEALTARGARNRTGTRWCPSPCDHRCRWDKALPKGQGQRSREDDPAEEWPHPSPGCTVPWLGTRPIHAQAPQSSPSHPCPRQQTRACWKVLSASVYFLSQTLGIFSFINPSTPQDTN